MDKIEEMKGRKVVINLAAANVFSVVLLIVSAVLLAIPFYLIWDGRPHVDEQYVLGIGIFCFPLFIAGIVAHEFLHGITWAYYAKGGWKSIRFGVMWKMLTPYCHCNEPMGTRAYMAGGLMPLVVLGILPGIVSLFTGSILLLIWGIFFIAAAGGDIWMVWLLSKEDPESTILDHPNEAGFYVFPKEEKAGSEL